MVGQRPTLPLFDFVNDDDVLGHGVEIGAGDEDDTVADGQKAAFASPLVDKGAKGGAVVNGGTGDRRHAPKQGQLAQHDSGIG